jgi:hypothetical protein
LEDAFDPPINDEPPGESAEVVLRLGNQAGSIILHIRSSVKACFDALALGRLVEFEKLGLWGSRIAAIASNIDVA